MTLGLKTPSTYYIQLITDFPPCPIASEVQLEATQQQINSILDRGNPTPDDLDYLRVLGMLVYEYETQHEVSPKLKAADFLRAMIEDMGLQLKDLVPILGSEALVMDVLSGRVVLNAVQMEQLATFFEVPPGAIA
jgi:HTH-type transcriptional regulator / antitoxin HigA